MAVRVEVLLLLWLILLDAGVMSGSLPDITDRRFKDECVRQHNAARSSVSPTASNMLHMTWDEGLAVTARAWAARCLYEHNIYGQDAPRMHPTFSSVGENLWIGSPPSMFDVTLAIEKWVNETREYDYRGNACTKVCGHYTQVVWASSYKVGCAVQLCPNGIRDYTTKPGAIFVCNYGTAGNFRGKRPYESEGPVCSGCDGYCAEKLCRNKERDSEKSYNWIPDWASVASGSGSVAGGSSYVPVVVVRPIALIFTFITAYAVRYFYPSVFCYE